MENLISQSTQALLESYNQHGGLNRGESANLPSKRAIATICEDLLQILFPGFHDETPISDDELPALTRLRISSLARRLEEQIQRSLQTSYLKEANIISKKILESFLLDLPRIRELLSTDIVAAYEGDPAAKNFEEIILAYPSLEAVAIQRMAHILYKHQVPLVPRIMTEWAHARTGIDIHPGAQIGSHFFIDHGTGVVIGETCVIGNWVKLYHGVTLGARSFPRDASGKIVKGGKRHPNVENNVTIHPNSTILGGETVIGEGSTIGANVFLMQSVPPRSLVFLEEKQVKIVPKK
ncbi:MAG: serine O-acetyltransferase [Chthoniobacterales bacterium]|nr:serine O-acetyltransferase [Chthoniobacterales bacterium]MCX7712903.1 serine O-acetyltransferase [Chthoniobacterales bacterium]